MTCAQPFDMLTVAMSFRSEIVGSLLLLSAPLNSFSFTTMQQGQGEAPYERFRAHLAAIVDHQSAYACRASTERTARMAGKGKPLARDRAHFDVATDGSTESYFWPDGGKLDQNAIEQIAQGEAGSANGVSAWNRVLLALLPQTGKSTGDCTVAGRAGLRFEVQTPWTASSYRVSAGGRRIVAAYTASVCADASTLDPMQFELRAALPAGPVDTAVETITYGPAKVGAADALLPLRREVKVMDHDGGGRVIVTTYTDFRPYAAPAPAPAGEAAALPPDIELDLKLDTAISFDDTAVGDAFTARLQRAIHKHGVDAPKGAAVTGRIARLEERSVPERHFIVGLSLLSLQTGSGGVPIQAHLTGPELSYNRRPESVAGFGDPNYMPPIWDARGLDIDRTDPSAQFGVFRVRDPKLKIAPGLHTIWRTGPPDNSKAPAPSPGQH